jgi:hypothetical protein
MARAERELELRIDADWVPVGIHNAAASTFTQLIQEVERTLTGGRGAVEWEVRVESGSSRLLVRGSKSSDAATAHAVAEAIANGVLGLAGGTVRPTGFSDRALGQVKALANLSSDELPVSIQNGGDPIPLTSAVAAGAEAAIGAATISYGVLEGRLESVQLHGPRPTFSIYSAIDGEKIECRLTDAISVEELRSGINRRVAVGGRIKTRAGGERVSIEPESLEVFPDEADLPSIDDARGILKRFA